MFEPSHRLCILAEIVVDVHPNGSRPTLCFTIFAVVIATSALNQFIVFHTTTCIRFI